MFLYDVVVTKVVDSFPSLTLLHRNHYIPLRGLNPVSASLEAN
jgi:hypothetical protein